MDYKRSTTATAIFGVLLAIGLLLFPRLLLAKDLDSSDDLLSTKVILKISGYPGASERAEIRKLLRGRIERVFKAESSSWFLVVETRNEDWLERLQASGLKKKIKIAEPVLVRKPAYTPNDPFFSKQWNLRDVRAPEAWDIEDGRKTEPVIAIVDSGADLDHPEISRRLWTNPSEVPGNGIDDDRNGYVDDFYGFNFTGVSQSFYNDHDFVGTTSGFKVAQTLLSKGETVTSLALAVARVGNPQSPLTVEIYEGKPPRFVRLVASTQINPWQVGSGASFVEARFSRPVYLKKDAYYTILLSAPLTTDRDFYLAFKSTYSYNEKDTFIRGEEWVYTARHGWVEMRFSDLAFRIHPPNHPYDDEGHGTKVSSIAAAETNNGTGIAGVAPKARLMILKVSSGGLIMSSDMIEAIYYAANNGASVVNLSLTGSRYSLAEQQAVKYATSKGLLVVAAAGNDGTSVLSYPAAYEDVVAVSSHSQSRLASDFSNYGTYIDLSAPGELVPSVTPSYSPLTSPVVLSSGTSMSAPHVSAAAGLCFSLQPELIGRVVEKALFSSAADLGPAGKDVFYGHGALDIYSALNLLKKPEIERIYGSDRIQTSVRVSQRFFPSADCAVIATAYDFPDSLSAVPLAAALSSPVLLTRPDTLVPDLKREIERLKPKRIYIIGGAGAVSLRVENEIKSTVSSSEVLRLGGSDRYETCVKVAEELKKITGFGPQSVYIATGENFPDALSASPLAASEKVPVLLVKRDSIPPSVSDWLRRSSPKSALIAGGTGAVSLAVEDRLKTFVSEVIRAAGADRYETNKLLQERAIGALGFSRSQFIAVTGRNFPDALSAGCVSGRLKAPLVLLEPDYNLNRYTLLLLHDLYDPDRFFVVGGPFAVPKSAVSRAFEAVRF